MGDTLNEVIGWLFSGLATLFGASGRDGLRQAMSTLFAVSPPDFSAAWFKSLYSVAWGLGLILSIPVSISMAVSYKRRTGGSLGGAFQALTNIPKTYVIIFALPVIAGVGVEMQDLLSSMVMSMFGAKNTSALDALGLIASTNPLDAFFLNGMLWVLSKLLSIEAFIIQSWFIFVVAFGGVVMALRGLGRFTEGLYETFVGVCLVGLISKPVMIGVGLFGSLFARNAPPTALVGGGIALLNFGTLLGTAAVPIVLFYIYHRKIAQYVGGRVGVEGNVTSRAPGITKVAIATGASMAGSAVAMRSSYNDVRTRSGSGSSGTLKTVAKTVANGVATKAALAGHPEVAVAAKAVAVGIDRIPTKAPRPATNAVQIPITPTTPMVAPPPPDREEGSHVGNPFAYPTR